MVTHGNWMPAHGKNAVMSSANMEIAMSQWNARAEKVWRRMRIGSPGGAGGVIAVAVGRRQAADPEGVPGHEDDARDQRGPHQVEGDPDEDLLIPWIGGPAPELHLYTSARTARRTRFFMSGSLYALWRSGCARRMAMSPAAMPVSSLAAWPMTARSASSSRIG